MADEKSSGKPPGAASVAEVPEQLIRDRALALWQADGSPETGPDEYWHRARELIEDEHQSAYPPAQSRGHQQ